MAQNIKWLGNTYQDVPHVELPKATTGYAQFTDVSPTTVTDDSQVESGKVYFRADGSQHTGSNSGGGGGSSMNFQIDNTNHRISATSYTETGAELTVAKSGTYNIYWAAFRSSTSSGTNGTQCYVNNNTQGSAQTSWSNSYCQTPKLTGVQLNQGDVVKIYARSSSTSRYVCVENLTLEQTA